MRRPAVVSFLASLVLVSTVAAGAGGTPLAPDGPNGGLSPREAFWYQRHLDLVARGERDRVPVPVRAAGPAEALTSVEDVQQISRWTIDAGGQDDTETEPDIAIDPNNPLHITATFQQGRFSDGIAGAAAIGFSTSHDGGETWTNGTLPGITEAFLGPYDRATDPAVAFGPDGEVYIQSLFYNASNDPNGIAVSRSDDGGLTWRRPVFAISDGASFFNDKSWIAVDTFPTSPFLGRIYITVTRVGIQLRYSDDQGQTWSSFKTVASGTGSLPIVQPDGDLTVVYAGNGVSAKTSTNGGDTFGPEVRISSLQATEPPDMRTGGLPSAAVDPVTGFLYASWQDTRFRSDGLNDIVLSRSTNGGATWAAVRKVTPGQSGDRIDHFTPDVAAYDHVVYVTYRVRFNRSSFTRRFVGMAYVSSANDGFDFGPQTRIGPLSDNNYAARASGNLIFYGDYMGMAAIGAEAHPVWNRSAQAPDHPTGPHQTSWSATILTP